MQAPEWQGDIIVIITRSSLFADSVFLGCSNARCLDLMCGASSQLRSRNSNTSLDKEGNAIRAKSTGLDLFRWTHIFPTKIAIWKVYPIFRQTHLLDNAAQPVGTAECISVASDIDSHHRPRHSLCMSMPGTSAKASRLKSEIGLCTA